MGMVCFIVNFYPFFFYLCKVGNRYSSLSGQSGLVAMETIQQCLSGLRSLFFWVFLENISYGVT